MCFVTLLVFACVPIPRELEPAVGKSTIRFVTNVTCRMPRMKSNVLLLCPYLEMCYLRSFAEQFADFTGRTYIGDTGAFYFDNIRAEDVNYFS